MGGLHSPVCNRILFICRQRQSIYRSCSVQITAPYFQECIDQPETYLAERSVTCMKKKINKGTLNYFVDVVIAIGFLISVGTGIALILAPSGSGFQGGRNPEYVSGLLGLSHLWWKSTHTWSSMLMAGGVLAHLLLHLKWIGCMTRKIFSCESKKAVPGVCKVTT